MSQDARQEKIRLRTALLERRDELPGDEAKRLGTLIQDRMLGLPVVRQAREALVYVAFRNEVSTRKLLEALWERGARVLLPRCGPARGEIELYCVSCSDHLRPGRFGIREPDPARCEPADDVAPDLIVVPGVAFDRLGGRLGFGGGYYDRLLDRPSCALAARVAPAYGFQVLDRLPRDPWDKPVHAIVTENETIEVGS